LPTPMYDGELLISERSKPKNMHWLPAGPWLVCICYSWSTMRYIDSMA
jgi:hypothetical protein